jgi:hypothetical protein
MELINPHLSLFQTSMKSEEEDLQFQEIIKSHKQKAAA